MTPGFENLDPLVRPRRRDRRVVVTGMGVISPIGNTLEEYWRGLLTGKSGIARVTFCDSSDYPTKIAGEVKDFDPTLYLNPKEARRLARFTQFAVAATRMALAHAQLDPAKLKPDRAGVLLGNGNGGFPTVEEGVRALVSKGGRRTSPFFMPMILPNMAASQVSISFGLKGYNSTIVTACAAGTQATGDAVEVIRRGACDVMVAGGTEAGMTEIGLAGFCAMRAMSTRNDEPARASRPFDALRDGFVASEGAAVLVLESLEHAVNRGALILAEMSGYGVSSDAYHAVQPSPDGASAALAMQRAIADAGIQPTDVDYINAHGTSTPLNDAVETAAIKSVFGEHAYRVPVSSTKSMIGHALGAAGALEAVACVKMIQEGVLHPTTNYENPDPACDLDYVPGKARPARLRHVLKNSFGFGGQNACLVVSKYE
ncbi:MAG: beta-ketoacyl-ACP synthase II [Dehalococcoidia bacterium]|nr:beta-ketoacyl-ACP synthase II [Dehalococcoidia bacterium]